MTAVPSRSAAVEAARLLGRLAYCAISVCLWGAYLWFGWAWWCVDVLGAPPLPYGAACGIMWLITTLTFGQFTPNPDPRYNAVRTDISRLVASFVTLWIIGLAS